MVDKTLQAMRSGGIYDQIGFGFHRYSTDSIWLVPHFEKMLYDQALMALAYLEAHRATGREEYAETAREVFEYVLRDMVSPEGVFYCAEDADNEGTEGKFYIWKEKEIRSTLDGDDADLAVKLFGVTRGGNFEGSNILHLAQSLDQAASSTLGITSADLQARMESIRRALLKVRDERVRPYRDDKILADWNGLMIGALARGAQVLGDSTYSQAATRAANFLLSKMRKRDGRLLHRYRDGETAIEATLDDLAFMIWAPTELYEATFEPSYLRAALELKEDLVKHFWDEGTGGFYLSPDDGEELLVRQKEGYDGAIPSGNSVAMLALMRLGRMLGDPDLEEKASQVGNSFANEVIVTPSGYTQMLVALDFSIGPNYEVVIAGDPEAEDTVRMIEVVTKQFLPNKVVLLSPADARSSNVFDLVDFLKDYGSMNGQATAYVCQNYACKKPTTDAGELVRMLSE